MKASIYKIMILLLVVFNSINVYSSGLYHLWGYLNDYTTFSPYDIILTSAEIKLKDLHDASMLDSVITGFNYTNTTHIDYNSDGKISEIISYHYSDFEFIERICLEYENDTLSKLIFSNGEVVEFIYYEYKLKELIITREMMKQRVVIEYDSRGNRTLIYDIYTNNNFEDPLVYFNLYHHYEYDEQNRMISAVKGENIGLPYESWGESSWEIKSLFYRYRVDEQGINFQNIRGRIEIGKFTLTQDFEFIESTNDSTSYISFINDSSEYHTYIYHYHLSKSTYTYSHGRYCSNIKYSYDINGNIDSVFLRADSSIYEVYENNRITKEVFVDSLGIENVRCLYYYNQDDLLDSVVDGNNKIIWTYNENGDILAEKYYREQDIEYEEYRYYRTEPKAERIYFSGSQQLNIEFNYPLDTSQSLNSIIQLSLNSYDLEITDSYISANNQEILVIEFNRSLEIGEVFELFSTQDLIVRDGRTVPLNVVAQGIETTAIAEPQNSETVFTQDGNIIYIENESGLKNAVFYNVLGNKVKELPLYNETDCKIDLSNLSSSTYFLTIYSNDGNTINKKIIIE